MFPLYTFVMGIIQPVSLENEWDIYFSLKKKLLISVSSIELLIDWGVIMSNQADK